MMYRECPECGAHLDPGEICECKKEGAPAGTGTPSKRDGSVTPILSSTWPDVNDCLQLRDICQSTGAMGKDIALVVRETFPKFTRQLLAQCQAPEKYGVVIHPEGLRVICDTYGLVPEEMPTATAAAEPAPVPAPARKPEKRKLPRKLTFRMTARDYARLVVRVENDGFDSVQSWLYDKIIKLLEGDADE